MMTSPGRSSRNYLVDKRVSETELQRRHSWLERTRSSIGNLKNRCRITHEIRFPDNFKGLYSARFSPYGDLIVSCFGTGGIQIRNGETGELETTLRGGIETSYPVTCCRFNPIQKDLFYVSGACGNIFMGNTRTRKLVHFVTESNNEINGIDVSVNGDCLVSGGKDAVLRIYDVQTAKLIHVYEMDKSDFINEKGPRYHQMRIFSTKFHTTYEELIVTGGWDDTVKIWDIRDGSGCIKNINGPHICGDAIDVREGHVLTGSWIVHDSLQIWDLQSSKLIETINPSNRPKSLKGEFLYTVQYFSGHPYGDIVLAGGSGTEAFEMINLKEKKIVGSYRMNKPVITMDSVGTNMIFGGMESLCCLAVYGP